MRIVIIGCGYVGSALAVRARAAGHEVWAVRRSSASAPAEGVHLVQADVSSGAGLEVLPRDADVVVYAVSPDERSDAAYRAAYPEGVRTVMQSLAPRRFLLVSSTSVYGETHGEWVDDATPPAPTSVTGEHIVAAEEVARSSCAGAVIVRPSGIYGPGRVGLLQRVRSGQAESPHRPIFTNRIHRDDLAGVLLFLAERPESQGVYLATDTEPAELGQLHAWLAERLGVPAPPVVSAPVVSAPPVVSGEASRKRHRASKRCVPRRLLEEGYTFLYPTFREGYTAILAAERQPDDPAR